MTTSATNSLRGSDDFGSAAVPKPTSEGTMLLNPNLAGMAVKRGGA